jgi:hypothetical protein
MNVKVPSISNSKADKGRSMSKNITIYYPDTSEAFKDPQAEDQMQYFQCKPLFYERYRDCRGKGSSVLYHLRIRVGASNCTNLFHLTL